MVMPPAKSARRWRLGASNQPQNTSTLSSPHPGGWARTAIITRLRTGDDSQTKETVCDLTDATEVLCADARGQALQTA